MEFFHFKTSSVQTIYRDGSSVAGQQVYPGVDQRARWLALSHFNSMINIAGLFSSSAPGSSATFASASGSSSSMTITRSTVARRCVRNCPETDVLMPCRFYHMTCRCIDRLDMHFVRITRKSGGGGGSRTTSNSVNATNAGGVSW